MRFSPFESYVRTLVSDRKVESAVALTFLLVAVVVFFSYMGEEDVAVSKVMPETYTLVRASHVPLSFEGVLVPADDVVLAAHVQGPLSLMPALEGLVVQMGDVLAVVGQPVLAAQRATLVAKIRVIEEQRGLTESQSRTTQTIAVASKERDTAAGTAQVALTKAQLDTAVRSLYVTLEKNYLSATEALNFLADTTALSTPEVSELRVAAARSLAGSSRANYLGQTVLTGGTERGLYDDLHALPAGDTQALLTLAGRLLDGLATLARAFEMAERVAYERTSDLSEEDRVRYNEYRAAVRTAQASIEESQGIVRAALEGHVSAGVVAHGTSALRGAELAQTEAVQAGEARVSGATLASLYAELRALDTSLGEAVVRAPYGGTITEIHAAIGAYVAPGTPLLRLESAGGFEVQATIPERYAHRLVVGAPVTFQDGSKGVLDRIAPRVDEKTGGVTAFIVVHDAVTTYTTGSRIRGDLELPVGSKEGDVFAVPHRFLFFEWDGPVVRTHAGSSTPVTIVRDTATHAYISGHGLMDGSALIP